MKTIKNIDEKPEHFQDDLPASVAEEMPTFRKFFKQAIALMVKTSPIEAIDLYQVGLKFKLSESDITVEDAEFRVIKNAVESNPAGWSVYIFAQILMKLREAEENKI